MNRGFESIGDLNYVHALYIGKEYNFPEIKRNHVYELEIVYNDKLGYIVTVLETGKRYAYADSWGKPGTLLKDWEVVTKRKPPG